MFRFETERLVVKPHTIDNARKFYEWDCDPELVYLNEDDSDQYLPATLEDVERYMEDISRVTPRRSTIHFAIHKKIDDQFIGYGMIAFIERQHRRCKLGITIGEKAEWGKGYAHEALVPVLGYCFGPLRLNRVMAEIYCINTRSIRLFEGLGFTHEGTLRQSVWKRGQPLDDCLYALLREDWERRTH